MQMQELLGWRNIVCREWWTSATILWERMMFFKHIDFYMCHLLIHLFYLQ